MLLEIGQDDFEVRRHDLSHVDRAVDDFVDETLRVEDRLLLDEQRSTADQERGEQLPERDVEALRRGLGDDRPRADFEVVDLREKVIEQT